MRWREAMHPVVMQRVALLTPSDAARDLLVAVADSGTVALEDVGPEEPGRDRTPAARRLDELGAHPVDAQVSATPPDLDRCVEAGRLDLLAGEAQVERRLEQAVVRGQVVAWAGWMPADEVPRLAARVAPAGGAVVPLPRPLGADPPTLLSRTGVGRDFAPLVQTYATVPYADVDPSALAGLAYVVMFGMMFADAGHGALLLLAALALRLGRPARLAARAARLRRYWLFLAGAGAASMVFGALYGEFFGPTGVLPVLWLAPLEEPITLLVAGVGVGALLLAGAYALGSVNRFREGGWAATAYAPTGLAGSAVFLGLALVGAGATLGPSWLTVLGAAVGLAGLTAAFLGLYAAEGGGGGAAAQAAMELYNLVVRLGSNLVSFARLAAFGLTHAALGAVVWQATTALWQQSALGAVGAAVVFLLGNALTFALEGVVAAIQALRLEYFELFSRVFTSEGRPFQPWHVPLASKEVPW